MDGVGEVRCDRCGATAPDQGWPYLPDGWIEERVLKQVSVGGDSDLFDVFFCEKCK